MKSRSHLLTLVGTALLGAVAGVFAWAAPAHAATINYVALGDSYSSGVGAGGYDPASGICERSPRSYTALWAAGHPGTAFTSVACGGATTDDVLSKQVGALSSATTMVTITIGGNDAGFVSVVTTCLLGTDGACSFAPHARVIVLGYPRLFELSPSCGLFGMDLAKRRTLDAAADTITGVIAGRAGAAGDTFVDARGAFAGHGICAGSPWINTTTWPVTDSYHPNSTGYRSGYLPALVGVTG